ncbi:MAG: ABC transporter permease, partial [Acidobacteria bacterium]|nr:ABC transporter permease [Acidobacteriota bacterium]
MIKHLLKLVWNRKRINFLITVEIFFSFLVVFAVLVFAVYYADNYRQPLGFNYENVWSVTLDMKSASMPEARESDKPQQFATIKNMLAGLREFSEVESAAGIWGLPYWSGDWSGNREINGKQFEMGYNEATDDVKEVLGLNVIRGRWFSKEDDGATNYRPVVINQLMATTFFGDQDPIGKDISEPKEKDRVEERVVGVVDDFRKHGEFSAKRGYVFHRNDLAGEKVSPPRSLIIKVRPGVTAAFEEKILARLQAEARDWSFEIKPLAQMRDENFQGYLVPIAAFGLIAAFLLIMVGLGLTGVLWQSVTQRIKEIGLRRAKGATAQRIYKQILAELFVITTIGLLFGVLVVIQFPLLDFLGFASGRVYAYSIAISLALIYLLTTVCGLYPSRLATKVQPAEALHYE